MLIYTWLKVRLKVLKGKPGVIRTPNQIWMGLPAVTVLRSHRPEGICKCPEAAFALKFNPATRHVNVFFALAESGPVRFQSFDAGGHLMATLVESDFAAGSHTLPIHHTPGVLGRFALQAFRRRARPIQ